MEMKRRKEKNDKSTGTAALVHSSEIKLLYQKFLVLETSLLNECCVCFSINTLRLISSSFVSVSRLFIKVSLNGVFLYCTTSFLKLIKKLLQVNDLLGNLSLLTRITASSHSQLTNYPTETH